MAGPEIIGYETDPKQRWTAPQMPDMEYDTFGISIPTIVIGYDGKPCEGRRYLEPDEIDGWMRYYGMRRVYRERPFRAELRSSGSYDLYCKRCGTWTTVFEPGTRGPHDTAVRHVKAHEHGERLRALIDERKTT